MGVSKVKVLAICPYEGMRGIMTELARQHGDMELSAFVGDLSTGLQVAQTALAREEYDVLISRGGTAEMLSHALDIPVLEIPLSGGDILQAIKLAENYQERFAIVGFPSITDNARSICDLLQQHIDTFTIHSEGEVPSLLEQLRSEGYTMVLCDMIASTVARTLGLNAVLITSSHQSIASTLEQAVRLSRSYRSLRRRGKLLELALSCGQTHTFLFDQQGKLLYAPDFLETGGPQVGAATRLLRQFQQNGTMQAERQIAGKHYSLTVREELLDGEGVVLIQMQTRREVLLGEDNGIQFFSRRDFSAEQFDHYYGSANSLGDIRSTITQYAGSNTPVLILGETGTGKDAAAAFLYENGPYPNKSFCVVDCGRLGDKGWKTLLESPGSPLHDTERTLHFKNLTEVSPDRLQELCRVMDATSMHKRNRLIFSLVTDSATNAEHPACRCLMEHMSCLTLYLPPLRGRTQDIPSLATLYINQLNLQLGKQIIGFAPGAMERIQRYGWPYNLGQFKRVLQELVTATAQFYISEESVEEHLRKEDDLYLLQSAAPAGNLDLTRSLSDINYDIVRIVMGQENGSPKKTAERLGISRSTVWRILKVHE